MEYYKNKIISDIKWLNTFMNLHLNIFISIIVCFVLFVDNGSILVGFD